MTHIVPLGISIVLTMSTCENKTSTIKLKKNYIQNFQDLEEKYTNFLFSVLNVASNCNRVALSFKGNYQQIIKCNIKATNKTITDKPNIDFKKSMFRDIINNLKNDKKRISVFKQFYYSDGKAKELQEIFLNSKLIKARKFIVNQAKEYHFTLINEAHYCGKHRAFTTSLLKSLWNIGYRYLALEGLGYDDPNLNKRLYPVFKSGYYTNESTYGNLIRKALGIGYQVISYETKLNNDGTARDYNQAKNILKKTWQQDKKGKVLIHAGYSHISESSDEKYKPMGSQLKKLTDQDILTIDQITMNSIKDVGKTNRYYEYVRENYRFSSPVIILDTANNSIVDFVHAFGIDIQVYHPPTKIIKGRPLWIKSKNENFYNIPKFLNKYKGDLFQIRNKNEPLTAVPIDQFVYSTNSGMFVLSKGNFILNVIDCKGQLVASFELITKK